MHPLYYSSLANNGSFGLEYLLYSEINDRTKSLLNDGIKLLCLIDEYINDNTVINESKLEKYEVQKMLSRCFDENEMKNIILQACNNKKIMIEIVNSLKVSEITTRKLQ